MTSPRRLHVESASNLQITSDSAFDVGYHVVAREGADWPVNDAEAMDVATVHIGENAAVIVSLFHTSPLRGFRIGLAYTLSTDAARETAAALMDCADKLEAAAAGQAREALARARGK